MNKTLETECHCITAEELISKLKGRSRLLLVDLRSFLNYSQCHLQQSINLSVPSTLLKRDNFCLSKLESVITCTQSRQKFKEREGTDVILYDNECDKAKSPLFCCLLKKFIEEHAAKSVSYLQGGFSSLMKAYPNYLSSKVSSPCVSIPNFSAGALDFNDVQPTKILDFLYMGTQGTASSNEALEKNGITCVLNTAEEIPNYFEGCHTYKYKKLSLIDAPTQCIDFKTLEEAFNFIEEAKNRGEKVLVHCRAGQSRSATIVIAYIMWSYHWPLSKAYPFVQERRPVVSPNLGFIAQLAQYDAKWKSSPHTSSNDPHLPLYPVDQIRACT